MGKRILIVDDEPNIVKMLGFRLKTNGYEILTAHDGQSGLKTAHEERPDLIVLDVTMPPPDGYEVCKMLKEDPAYCDIPVILLTARVTERDKTSASQAKPNAYMSKPYESEALLAKIRELIG